MLPFAVSRLLEQTNLIHPVLEGKATLRSKFLQTLINISGILMTLPGRGRLRQNFLVFLKRQKMIENLQPLNFRCFIKPVPSCIGWVDASDHAVGGIIATLVSGGRGLMPVTVDNWVLDGSGMLPRIHNCAHMLVDGFPLKPTVITDRDLDPGVVQDIYIVHRNLTYAEHSADSSEREL